MNVCQTRLKPLETKTSYNCHTQTLDTLYKRSVTFLKDRISCRFYCWAPMYGIATRYGERPFLARKFFLSLEIFIV